MFSCRGILIFGLNLMCFYGMAHGQTCVHKKEHLDETPYLIRGGILMPQLKIAGQMACVEAVSSHLRPIETLNKLEKKWRGNIFSSVIRLENGGWKILSRYNGYRIETLQLRPERSGAEGFLSYWQKMPGSQKNFLGKFLPKNGINVQQMQWVDKNNGGDVFGEILVAHLPEVLEVAEMKIKDILERFSYRLISGEKDNRAVFWRDHRARVYANGHSEILVTLHRDSAGSNIVMYESTR